MPLIVGNDSDENILGTPAPDTILANGGNDQVRAGGDSDAVSGGTGSDLLFGQDGNDFIYGNEGDDQLDGGTGDDLIDGGQGTDIASYLDDADRGVTVDLNLQGFAQSTGMGADTLVGIEHVVGTLYDDVLTGDSNDNWLWGGTGTDLAGGDDTISGGGGNDLIQVGLGNYVLDGGEGSDTLSLYNPNFDTVHLGGTVDLRLQGSVQEVGAASMLLTNFENVTGSIYDDVLIGDDGWNNLNGDYGDDILIGGDGGDALFGDGRTMVYADAFSGTIQTFVTIPAPFGPAAGADTLEGGLGDDFLNGGGGTDTIRYDHAAGGVQVTLADSGFGTSSGADGNDIIQDVEFVVASAFNDTVTGNSGVNHLYGGDGHDLISGGAGDDLLNGGNGDDRLSGDAGDDMLVGGSGFDTVSYDGPGAVTVDLRIAGVAQNTGQGMDTLDGIENVIGSAYADLLIGNSGDNWIDTGASAVAGANSDTIFAQGGNDLVTVDAGDHTLSGGPGTDTISFQPMGPSGITFSLALQGSDQDTGQGTMLAIAFENVSGSYYDDVLTGDGNDNILLGNTGNDTLDGGTGNDTLYGDGAIAIDNHETGSSGPITLYPDYTAFGVVSAAVVTQESDGKNDDMLSGGKGDDMLYGGVGDDVLAGGLGKDTFVIAAQSGDDRVTDFSHSDTIAFDASSGVKSFSELVFTAAGNGTLVSWGTDDSILVEGIKPKQLTTADFHFSSDSPLSLAGIALLHEGAADQHHELDAGLFW